VPGRRDSVPGRQDCVPGRQDCVCPVCARLVADVGEGVEEDGVVAVVEAVDQRLEVGDLADDGQHLDGRRRSELDRHTDRRVHRVEGLMVVGVAETGVRGPQGLSRASD